MFVRSFGLSAVLAVLLAGPVLADPTLNAADRPVLEGRGGVVVTETGAYSFDPTMCGMAIEDGMHDIEVYGPGTSPDGGVVFVEYSSTGRHLSISFDVTSVFDNADRQLVADDFDIEVSGTAISAENFVLRDLEGGAAGRGRLAIDCRPA